MNFTSVALKVHSVDSVGWMRCSSGIEAGAGIAERFAMVVDVGEFKLIEDAPASVPVLIDQRSELHCPFTVAGNKTNARQKIEIVTNRFMRSNFYLPNLS